MCWLRLYLQDLLSGVGDGRVGENEEKKGGQVIFSTIQINFKRDLLRRQKQGRKYHV